MRTRLLLLAATLALVSTAALAADHPDISGKWQIDAAKSNFGPMPAPADLAFEIKSEGDDFTVHQTGGGQADTDLRFNTAGKEVTNQIPGGTMTSTHHWEAAVLVGEIRIVVDSGDKITFKDRISCSPDGKVMTVQRQVSSLMGEGQITIVLDKQ